jgi:ZIP family zinc transporter
MFDAFRGLSPVYQALVATTGTCLLTAIGTLPVFFFRSAPRLVMDGMMGFAGGVMVAAACWSLLMPAIGLGGVPPAAVGLLAGGAFMYFADQMLPHVHAEFPDEATSEGLPVDVATLGFIMHRDRRSDHDRGDDNRKAGTVARSILKGVKVSGVCGEVL